MTDIVERISQLPELANLPGGALAANCFEAAIEIKQLRAENEKLRAELEAMKSPPDYGTQKIMNEQIHYAGLIAQKDREIARLRAENEKLRAERDECERQLQSSFREMGEILEERNVLRVAFEQAANEMRPMLSSMISRGEAAEIVRRAAAAALKETGDE